MPASRQHQDLPPTPGSVASNAPANRNIEKLSQLFADGEIDWPTDFSPADADQFTALVRERRRARLVRVIARVIAADLVAARNSGV